MKKRRVGKTILRVLVIAVMSAVIGWSAYSVNASKILGNAMPMPFGIGIGVVESGSMEPELSVGDVIVVREAEAEEYKEGDVVVYQSGKSLVVHRIIEKQGEGKEARIVTQGDANNAPDEPITGADIRGELKLHIPKLGYMIDMIRTPTGIIVTIGIAVILLEGSFRREKKTDEENRRAMIEEIRRLRAEMNGEDEVNEGK